MDITLTGIKNLDVKILNKLSDEELVKFCSLNHQTYEFCNKTQGLWQDRTFQRYGDILTGEEMRKYKGSRKWSEYYVELKKLINGDSQWKHPELNPITDVWPKELSSPKPPGKFLKYILAKAMELKRNDIVKILNKKGIKLKYIDKKYPQYRVQEYVDEFGRNYGLRIIYYEDGDVRRVYTLNDMYITANDYKRDGTREIENFVIYYDPMEGYDNQRLSTTIYDNEGKIVSEKLEKYTEWPIRQSIELPVVIPSPSNGL